MKFRSILLLLILCLLTSCTQQPPTGSTSAPPAPDKPAPPALTWQELYDRGTESLSSGDYASAVQSFEEAADKATGAERIKTLLSLSNAYEAVGDIVKAKDAQRMALEAPRTPSALTTALNRIAESGRATARTERTDGTGGACVISEYDAKDQLLRRTERDQQGNFYFFVPEYEAERLTRLSLFTVDGALKSYEAYEYDGAGNVARETHHWADGFAEYSHTYEYDAAHRKIRATRYDSNGAATNHFTYEYDGSGNLIRETGTTPGGAGWRSEYDSSGRAIRHAQLTPDGTEDSSAAYEYTADGKLARETQRRLDVVTAIIEYDEEERHSTTIKYRTDGNVESIFLSQYNLEGQLILETTLLPSGSILFSTNYDGSGRYLSESQYRADGSLEWRREYGDSPRTTYYNPDGTVREIVLH